MDFVSQLVNYNPSSNTDNNTNSTNWIASSNLLGTNSIVDSAYSMPPSLSVHNLPGSTNHLDTTTYHNQATFGDSSSSPNATTPRTSKPKTSRSAKDKNRPKRKQVKNACVNCQKACKKCDEGRPCQRCIKLGLTATCVDSPRKERRKGVKRGPYRKRQQQQQQENPVIGSASGQQRLTYGYNEQFNIFASPSGAHQFVQQQQRAGPFPWTGSTTATRFAQQQQQQQQANWPSYSQPAISSLCHLQPNQFYETTPQQQQRGTAIDLDPYSFLMQNDPVIMFPSQRTSPISAQPAATSSLLYPNSPTDSLVQSSPASSTLAGSSPEPPTTPPLMSSQTSSVFVPPPSYVPSQVATAHHTMQADPNYTAVPFAKHQQHFPIFHQINHHSTATGKVLF